MKAWAEITPDDLRWVWLFLYTRGDTARNLLLLLLFTFGGVALAGFRLLYGPADASGWGLVLACAVLVVLCWLLILWAALRAMATFLRHPGLLGHHEWELMPDTFAFRGPQGETVVPLQDCRLYETRINAYVMISANTFVSIPKRNLQSPPGFMEALRMAMTRL